MTAPTLALDKPPPRWLKTPMLIGRNQEQAKPALDKNIKTVVASRDGGTVGAEGKFHILTGRAHACLPFLNLSKWFT